MDPEHEIARKAGLLAELESFRHWEQFFGMGTKMIAFVGTLLFAAGTIFKSENELKLSACVFVLAAAFAAVEWWASKVRIPNILADARRRLEGVSGDPKGVLLQKFLDAGKETMFDEGFREIQRSKNAQSHLAQTEVMGRGFYSGGATATAEEFAVLYQNKVIAMSRVIAIDGNAVWLRNSDTAFEGGPTYGGVWGEVVRAMAMQDLGDEAISPIEVICLGLQSSAESALPSTDASKTLSRSRAQRLVNTMANRSLTWTDHPNVRVLGFDLGKARTAEIFGSEPERRQRSGIIILLTRDFSYEAVLPFTSAIAEILSVCSVNGTDLQDHEHADNISRNMLTASLGGSESPLMFRLDSG